MHTTTRPWLRFIEGPGGSAGSAETEAPAGETADEAAAGTGDSDAGGTDWQAKYEEMRRHSRTWETRAKENAAAAEKLKELEDRDKSDAEKALERAQAAEAERDAAIQDALRLRIATEHGLTADDAELFLTGTDEDTMRRQAQALADRAAKARPAESPGQVGGDGSSRAAAQDWAKRLLGKD